MTLSAGIITMSATPEECPLQRVNRCSSDVMANAPHLILADVVTSVFVLILDVKTHLNGTAGAPAAETQLSVE